MSLRFSLSPGSRFRPPWFLLLLLFALPVATGSAQDRVDDRTGARQSTVILISLDGTRPSDIREDTLPSLLALGRRGAVSPGLIPATPANTFPSHVTLVTGVEPNRHGIVNNYFVDPSRGPFRKKDIPSWIEVEPLWSLLEGEGVVSASYHWVGSEGPWRSGRGPKHWEPFSSSVPAAEKVEKILGWLDLEDPAERPRFITAWFPGADHAAHLRGPGSVSARKQLAKQQPALDRLITGIGDRGLWPTTTLMVVSDHGMLAAETLLDFDRVVNDAGIRARISGMGGFATVVLSRKGPEQPDVHRRIIALARESGLEAIVVGRGHEELSFTHPRFGDLILRAPLGTAIHRPGLPTGGFHGYASHEPAMHGVMIAAGRGVSPGLELPLLHATDIAPTVLDLLGVAKPAWMKGRAIRLEASGALE